MNINILRLNKIYIKIYVIEKKLPILIWRFKFD